MSFEIYYVQDRLLQLEELLEDNDTGETLDDNDINTISYPIKIADDEFAGTDDEE